MKLLDIPSIVKLINITKLSNIILGVRNTIYRDFTRWNQFDKSVRVANHSKHGVIELMPISNKEYYTFKYVNGHPINTFYNLPTVMAFGTLSEVKTGKPLLLSELTILTAIRTAATSVMAAQLVARSNCISMAVIGNGAQSEFQILAFYYLMGIDKYKLYDIDKMATQKLVNNMIKYPHIKCIVCNSTMEACKDVDIITTITADKTNAIILNNSMISKGQHINAVGGDCPGKTELSKDILERSDVFTEYTPQTRIEGEIQQMPTDFKVTELQQVIKDGYTRLNDKITVFDSVGFALEDYSTLDYFYNLSKKYNIGKKIDIIPEHENPKNLFSFVKD
jgi:ornithine cyclodeaminase